MGALGAGRARQFWISLLAMRNPEILNMSLGWMGGFQAEPTLQQVREGTTGHAEVVHLTFRDKEGPAGTTFQRILRVFWALHDPFEVGRQGNDIGSQFRSVIFCYDASQVNT